MGRNQKIRWTIPTSIESRHSGSPGLTRFLFERPNRRDVSLREWLMKQPKSKTLMSTRIFSVVALVLAAFTASRFVSKANTKIIGINELVTQKHGNNSTPSVTVFALSEKEALLSLEIAPEKRKPLCNRDQVRLGEWIPHEEPKVPYVTPTVHLRCFEREYYDQKPWPTWRWKPHDSSCSLTTWNRTTFCNLMKGATVSIVGDSLSWEHYSSLVQLNGVRTRQGYQHQSRELHVNIQQPVCNGETRIVYRRDDRLSNVTESLRETFPTVLVLNRGAHYANDSLHLDAVRSNLEEVKAWQQTCRDTYEMKCHFFWRTSVPGHPECGKFKEPINDMALMEQRVANLSFYDNKTINYHWYDYQHQNKLVLQLLKESGVEYNVIDAYDLNMLRPDLHRAHQDDCLHNCYPGKMDVYSQILLHFLRIDREHKDITRSKRVALKQGWNLTETTVYDKEATEKAKGIREGTP